VEKLHKIFILWFKIISATTHDVLSSNLLNICLHGVDNKLVCKLY
jgi:hypothetical protein